ncbi:bacteriophage antitermination protein Q [Erwiniaceae bacterium L1_54_6]|nr:bacteriophage antitermination protein Q [Erwiniaceae bacterium L1_54_6]
MINYPYIRVNVSNALAEIIARTKGQLQAFSESPMTRTTVYTRKKVRTVELEKRSVCALTDPVKSSQTRVSKKPRPPIDDMTFESSSWRRAVAALNPDHHAWISYCYGRDLNYDHQLTICSFITNEFAEYVKAAGVSKKVAKCFLGHFEQLSLQIVAYELRGENVDRYTQAKLAQMAGVKPDNWNKHYKKHWEKLLEIGHQLDMEALRSVQNKRHESFSKNFAA